MFLTFFWHGSCNVQGKAKLEFPVNVKIKERRHTMAKTARTGKEGLSGAGLGITTVDKLARDASEVGVGVVTILAALIGIWGLACLIGGVANEGLVELFNGYMSAITGR